MGVLPDWMIEQYKPLSPIEPGIKREGKISHGLSSYGYDIRLGYKFKVFTNVWGSVVDPKQFDPKSFVEVDLENQRYHQLADSPREGKEYYCRHCDKTLEIAGELLDICPNRQQFILIPPNSFALGETIEEFNIPRDVLGIIIGKSSYARCGIIINCTPLEPEWTGKVTLEISNTTPLPAKVYAGEGIAQVYFLRSDGARAAMQQFLTEHWPLPQVPALGKALLKMGTCRVSYADKKGKYQAQQGLTLPKVD